MGFFTDKRGVYYPISEITKMVSGRSLPKDSAGKHRPSQIYLKDDEYGIEVFDETIDDVLRSTVPTVAAYPGFTLLTYWAQGEGEEPVIDEQPVVAWQRNPDEGLVPVVLDEAGPHSKAPSAILLPSGEVVRPGDCTWESRAKWEESMKAQEASRAAERAKAKSSPDQ